MRAYLLVIPAILMLTFLSNGSAAEATWYYTVEINGVKCGYAVFDTTHSVIDGMKQIVLKHRLFLMLSALGSQFNTEVKLTYHIDPATGQFTYHDSEVHQGPVHMTSEIHIDGLLARFTSSMSMKEETTELPPAAILDNTLFHPFLINDFVAGGLEEKTYNLYEVRENEMQQTRYTKTGVETLELAGERYETVVLDGLNLETGMKFTMWVDTATGRMLQTRPPNNRLMYLSDASIVNQIEIANLDENIASKVDVAIADIHAISYMKVKAKIEPIGLWVTPGELNVPGQRFEGTVMENLVEGIFEIEHPRYDGTDAPPFPPDFSGIDSLKEYLEPDDHIESTDPILVEKAREITKGSKDAWEAAVSLSRWVSAEIGYAIPGGVTARDTYDKKIGECGAHSLLLAAFCRAVGIPARVVWGCMYIPNFGGAFGQHGWNEIYMGKAGWIPVDATAGEHDFADSGHIRVGTLQSATTALNPKEMEVLDYRLLGVETAGDDGSADEETTRYREYFGKYIAPSETITLSVFLKDGSLTLDIPGKIMLALHEPDEEGRWYAKLSNRLFIEFERNEHDNVTALFLHELIEMPRKSDPEEIPEDVPAGLKPYLGVYSFLAAQAEFRVYCKDGELIVHNSLDGEHVRFQPPDERGRWKDEYNKNEIFFETHENGTVRAMGFDAINRFKRID
ncbi:MAG: transglutaminase domain-containing protein [bacterium]|nr:MAG: transglutaminase domain-containing protein [bacterium]